MNPDPLYVAPLDPVTGLGYQSTAPKLSRIINPRRRAKAVSLIVSILAIWGVLLTALIVWGSTL